MKVVLKPPISNPRSHLHDSEHCIYLMQTVTLKSTMTGIIYYIKQNITCGPCNVVYFNECKCPECQTQFMGKTTTDLCTPFRNRKSTTLIGKMEKLVAKHFNLNHSVSDLSVVLTEMAILPKNIWVYKLDANTTGAQPDIIHLQHVLYL